MRFLSVLAPLLFLSCHSTTQISDSNQSEFTKVTQAWQTAYTDGSQYLEVIMSGLDQNIILWENGNTYTYSELEKIGPHLPVKNVIETYDDHYLIDKTLGYNYVSQLYISSISGDTMRETSSRIWSKETGLWKITRMNNLIKKEAN